jgi:hypothetical protein
MVTEWLIEDSQQENEIFISSKASNTSLAAQPVSNSMGNETSFIVVGSVFMGAST